MNTSASNNWFDKLDLPRRDDSARSYRILVVDHVGLQKGAGGLPDCSAFVDHIRRRGAQFVWQAQGVTSGSGNIVFEYRPELYLDAELIQVAAQRRFDGVIAAATRIPPAALFPEGGVRIGAGTANMASESFTTGCAPLMNTPGFNSRATAQMVFKALLRVSPDLPLEDLHQQVVDGRFDTGVNLSQFPTRKLEGQRIAVLGYGNIGREVALLGQAFGMRVSVYARPALQSWIEAQGFDFCSTPRDAANGADVLSVHLGLGRSTEQGFSNLGIIDSRVLHTLAPGAVLINFDRGELLNVADLSAALDTGKISKIAIDADIFQSPGGVTGPLEPYLALESNYKGRVLLLPHAAADTDHPSRVAGAIQAADQMLAAIRFGSVMNLVGSLPDGYHNLGIHRPPGIGRVSAESVASFASNRAQLAKARNNLAVLDKWLVALGEGDWDSTQAQTQDTQAAVLALNQLCTDARSAGLVGPGDKL